MSLSHRWALPFVIVVGLLSASCGGEDPPAGSPEGDSKASGKGGTQQAASQPEPKDIFASKDAGPIEVTTIDRDDVSTDEEATGAIKVVRKFYNDMKVPEPVQAPFSYESMRQYLTTMKFIKEQRKVDLAWLHALDAEKLTGGDSIAMQNFTNLKDNVLSRLEKYLPGELEYADKHSREILAANLQNDIDLLKKGADADPSKDYDVKNVLTDEFDMRLRDQAIERIGGLLPLAEMLDAELGVESKWPAQRDEIRQMVTKYRANVTAAAGAVKPPADINNAELTRIATEVLTNPKMGLPKAERIIVNFDKQQKNRTEFVVDDGVVTKVVRRWDEFQAATIEKADNGKYYLYFNDILYYHEGPNTVPLGKWVLGPRFQSAPILEENINK
ncbi:MAG: hypothetical protein MPJ50_14080 [Pirellulales bacterium]|nr:hypothetical protein [Pirellulales bacterium]